MTSRMEELVKMLITGKATDPAPLPETPKKGGIKTLPFVEAGQTIAHNGPLHITGPVGAGATVKVKKGGLLIDGEVGDGANISVEDDGVNHIISVGRGGNVSISNITVSGSSRVVINGRDVTEQLKASQAEQGPEGLTIKGVVGAGVSLHSSSDITLEQLAAAKLTARAGRDVTGYNIGKGADLNAGRDVTLRAIFDGCAVNAGRDLKLGKAHESCALRGARDVRVGHVDPGTRVSSGRDVTIDYAATTVPVEAGRDASVHVAIEKAIVRAGRKVAIKQRLPG